MMNDLRRMKLRVALEQFYGAWKDENRPELADIADFLTGRNKMSDKDLLKRIEMNPDVMTGKPVIKGTRLTVEFILNLMAHGETAQEILDEYQGLTQEDIQACILFASKTLENTFFMPLSTETT